MHRPLPSPTPGGGPAAFVPDNIAVLDTQVVLDWLVFRDASAASLGRAIENRSVRWLASAPMLREIERVLDRGVGAAWSPDRAAIRDTCARLAHPVQAAADSTLRCADPDDQMFIDLALAVRACWLFTRDKALLRLAPRARVRGVCVLRPADWQVWQVRQVPPSAHRPAQTLAIPGPVARACSDAARRMTRPTLANGAEHGAGDRE